MSEQTPATQDREPRRIAGPGVVLGIIAIIAALSVGAVVAPSLSIRAEQPELEVFGTLPHFSLRDHTGQVVSNSELAGKVLIVNFIFTRCPTICPLFTLKMRKVQDDTVDVAGDLKLLSFSVDPEYDTPEVLARYAAGHGVDDSRWRLLTGSVEDIRRIATGGLALALDRLGEGPGGVPDILHAEHFVLIDRQGQIRGYYDSNDITRVDKLMRDARRLIHAR